MKYKRFEDLPVYQLAEQLNMRLLPVVANARARRDFRYAEQLRSAALSITNNIAEGFERDSIPEFINFLRISKGSAGEVRSLLRQALHEEMGNPSELQTLHDMTLKLGQNLAGFIRYLKSVVHARRKC